MKNIWLFHSSTAIHPFFLFPLVNLQRTISQSQICGQIRHCSLFKRVFSSWFQPWVLRWGSAHEAWHRKNVKIWAPVALSRIAIIIVRNDRSIETVSCTRVDLFRICSFTSWPNFFGQAHSFTSISILSFY